MVNKDKVMTIGKKMQFVLLVILIWLVAIELAFIYTQKNSEKKIAIMLSGK